MNDQETQNPSQHRSTKNRDVTRRPLLIKTSKVSYPGAPPREVTVEYDPGYSPKATWDDIDWDQSNIII